MLGKVLKPSFRVKMAATLFLLAVLVPASAQAADAELTRRLALSTQAFEELMASSDVSIPKDLLAKSEAVVVFPRTLNLAWGIGGQYGKGVLLRHDKKSGRFGAPAFYTLSGLTFGPQIGGQSIDIVLVVMNEKGLKSLLESKSTLGADAGIAVGPAGRNATASTDLGLAAEIYSYSRAKGLYIGLSLKGAVVNQDRSANALYYGREVSATEILLERKVAPRSEDAALRRALDRRASAFPLLWVSAASALVLVAGAAFFMRHGRR